MNLNVVATMALAASLGMSMSLFADSGRANFGLEVGPDGGAIELDVLEGTVLVRTIGTPGGDLYDAAVVITFSEGNYQISAATTNAHFSITWDDPLTFGEGDITPVAINGTNASVHFGKGHSDREDLWFGTHAGEDSSLEFHLRAFGSSDREFGWVNEVTNDGSFTMPAEADGETDTTFPDSASVGDHEVNLNPRSIVWIRMDGGGDGDGGGGDGGGGGGGDFDGLMIHFVEIDAASIQLTSSEIPEVPEEGDYLTRTITVDLGESSDSSCGADINGDGEVDGADLGLLLGAWGVCP